MIRNRNITKPIIFGTCIFTIVTLFVVTSCSAQTHTDLPQAPDAFIKLLHVDDQDGIVLRPESFDLTKPGAKWIQDAKVKNPDFAMVYEQTYQGYGSYKFEHKTQATPDAKQPESVSFYSPYLVSENSLDVKRNRTYMSSALIKTDFQRTAVEANFMLKFYSKDDKFVSPRHPMGAPAITKGPDGWERLTWKVTIPDNPLITQARPAIRVNVVNTTQPIQIDVADFAFVELPPQPLIPLSRGEGVTFPGGPGNLPMHVESARSQDGHIIVETSGAKFDFNTKDDTILASQRIEFPRDLAKWHSSLSLAGLKIDKKTPDVCVLTNDQLTIGIQGDSMMAISPQKELIMELTNLLGGDWNRYERGHLLSLDDFGGITVNPYIPMGTGRLVRTKLLTKEPIFATTLTQGVAPDNQTRANTTPPRDMIPGAAQPNWKAQWTTSPGELLCTSVFPPKPYPWEESFHFGWQNMSRKTPIPTSRKPFVNTRILWDFNSMTWGHSFSDRQIPYDEKTLHTTVQSLHDIGYQVVNYMSAFWTPSRDANVYIDAVREWKDKYGIDGIYSDGLPSADWLLAYKEMRMLRELFPNGPLLIHDSTVMTGRSISQFKPFLYAYATATYLGESEFNTQGEKWKYPRYITSQFRKANIFGAMKGNVWFDSNGADRKPMPKDGRSALVELIYNGRDSRNGKAKYFEALSKLHKLWQEKGDQPHFYDRYYLPDAQKLTGYHIGRTAMPIVQYEMKDNKVQINLKSLTPDAKIHYTVDGSNPTVNSPLYEGTLTLDKQAAQSLKACAFADGLEPSAISVGYE